MIHRTIVVVVAAIALMLSSNLAVPVPGRAAVDAPGTAESEDWRTAPVWDYRVVAEFPHDSEAYTQGLIYYDGRFLEGTGLTGESTLRRVEIETGEVIQRVDLYKKYFGEGIALLDGRIYQLTWQNEICLVYDVETFDRIDFFTYSTEGWGLTNDETRLFMSDGSHRLYVRDPETFWIEREIEVYDGDQPVGGLNELEWVDGEVWANVYQTDWIVRIDPETGEVVGWIDLTGLLPLGPDESLPGVLNGIARDAETGRLFVTGKRWPSLFEIELVGPRSPE